jgi:6-pyruvoyl-tetrahydropterin synthase related domain
MNAPSRRTNPLPPNGSSSWLYALGLSLLASLALLTPFFWLGAASGHDFEFHVASWLDVAYQWHHGVFYPRWTSWTNYGFGEPRYIFYPPLSWMLGAFLSLVLPISWVPAAFVLLTQTFAGVSAFFLLRRLTSPTASYIGAVFYAVNPYALLVSYIRSDFAEQLACAFFPLLLLAALRIAGLLDEERPGFSDIVRFAVPFAAIWLCNAPAGVIASYAMALLFAYAVVTQCSLRVALRAAAGLALGFGLTAFYVVPATYEQRWVNIAQALSSGLLPSQNFLFTKIDDVEHTWFNWISSICALVLILVSALTALACRRLAREASSFSARRVWPSLLLLGAAATILMLRFTLPLWNLLPKLRFVQFSWRWMSILAVIGCCFLAAAAERRRGWLWLAFYLVFAVPLGFFLTQNTWWDPDEMSTQQAAITSGTGYEGVDEYDPIGDDHLDLAKHAPLAAIAPGTSGDDGQLPDIKIQVESWEPEAKRISVQSTGSALIALRLLNYPAWQVTVNGRNVPAQRPEDVNQMLVPVSSGTSEIQIHFTRTRDRTLGMAVSLICLMVALILLFR